MTAVTLLTVINSSSVMFNEIFTCLSFVFLPPDSKRECIERFGKQPNARILRDDDQLCTTEYSRIVPLENGEV